MPGDLAASRIVLDSFRSARVLRPVPAPPPSDQNILLLAPHPDDESIGAGGTLLQAHAAGCAVDVLFLTTGREQERDVRRQEANAVCEAAGFTPHFAGQNADAIDTGAAARALLDLLDGRRFDSLFVPFLLDDHDDHRQVNEILLAAAEQDGGDALPREVWAYHVYGPGPMNCVIDISNVAERKRALIGRHQSQMKSRDWAHFALGMNAVLSRFLLGSPEARYAEGFMVTPTDSYLALAGKALACGLYLDPARNPETANPT